MNEQLTYLGTRIKELRQKRRLTLQQLAARTKLTAGLLSKIENFRTIPSLPVLICIARALDEELSHLFEGIHFTEHKPWVVVRQSEQYAVEREDSSGLEYKMIFESGLQTEAFQLMLVTIHPGAKRKQVTGEGKELLYMLSGSIEYQVGNELLTLNSGDMLFFDSTLPHVPRNNSKSTAVLLALYFLKTPLAE